jgi:hypothetical protein
VKVTLIAQLAPAASFDPHVVLACVNSPALLAWFVSIAKLLISMSELAVLLSVSVSAPLWLPTI